MVSFVFARAVDAIGCLFRYPDVLRALPQLLGRAEEVLGEAVRCKVLAGRGVWATFRIEGKRAPRAVLKVVSPRRSRLAAVVNDPNLFYANETPLERSARERDVYATLGAEGLAPSLLDAGEHYLLMDYISGPSLADFQAASKTTLIPLVERLIEALGRLHALGFTHGDARPDNVIVAQGEPVFIDFEHLIDPDRPLVEQRALDWLRFLNHLHYFRGDLVDDGPHLLLEPICRIIEPETIRHILSLADHVPYTLPATLLERLEALVA